MRNPKNFPHKPPRSQKPSSVVLHELSPKGRPVMPGAAPHYRETEAAVLGAILIESDARRTVLDIIPDAACFYHEAHKVVFEAIQALDATGSATDLLTVTEHLRRSGNLDIAGGAYGLTQMTIGVVSSAHVQQHSLILMEQWMKRQMLETAFELYETALDPATDALEALDSAESRLASLSNAVMHTPFRALPEAAAEVLADIKADRESGKEVTGLSTGLRTLDEALGGMHPGNLIVIAARPAVGKTAFGLNIGMGTSGLPVGMGGAPVGIFSLEMSVKENVQRILADDSNVELSLIRKPLALSQQGLNSLEYSVQKLRERGLYIDDTAGLSIPEFRAKARRLVYKHGVRLILIDYLQLMSGDTRRNGNREQEVAQISRELKKTAKELQIPIIAFSQMNRTVETRGGKKPQLSDLRESGAIEQDADVVGFLYRPSVEEVQQNPALLGTGSLWLGKNRHGAADVTLTYRFNGPNQRWEELSAEVSWNNHPQAAPRPMPQAAVAVVENPDDLPF